MSEDLKSKRGVEGLCRSLSGVDGERNALQAGLRPRHAKQLPQHRLTKPFSAPALGYVESPEKTVVVPLRFRAAAEPGAAYQLAVRESADDEAAVRGVPAEARPGLLDRHRMMLLRRLAERARLSLHSFQSQRPECFGVVLCEQANIHLLVK